jgi:predicted nucleotidyltransferase component of viral defense system
MNAFLEKTILEQVALETGINKVFLEKDWFVTKVIRVLSENQYPDFFIVFTGGTALSKAHKLVERFSEDVDFRIISPRLDAANNSQVRKALSGFKKHLCNCLQKEFSVKSIEARDNNRHIVVELDYPTICEKVEFLRPHVKVEFMLSNLLLPGLDLPVSSFINELTKQKPEVEKIMCIDPVENAADKLSAIAWRIPSRLRGNNDREPDVVRHLHDLAKLSWLVLSSPDFPILARETIRQDATRSSIVKDLSAEVMLCKMMAILEADVEYAKEYERFVTGMSYAEDTTVPTFAEAIRRLKLIVETVIQDV